MSYPTFMLIVEFLTLATLLATVVIGAHTMMKRAERIKRDKRRDADQESSRDR